MFLVTVKFDTLDPKPERFMFDCLAEASSFIYEHAVNQLEAYQRDMGRLSEDDQNYFIEQELELCDVAEVTDL